MKKLVVALLSITLFSCIGDDFNTDKLSGEIELDTGLALPLVNASVTMADIFSESADYVKYYTDEQGFERIMLYQDKDSVRYIDLDDIYQVEVKSADIPIPFLFLNDGAEHTIDDVNIPIEVDNGSISKMKLSYELHVSGTDFATPLYVRVFFPTVNAEQGGKTIEMTVDNDTPVIQFHENDSFELVDGKLPTTLTFRSINEGLRFNALQIGTLSVSMEKYNFDYIKGTLTEIITRFDRGSFEFDFDILEEMSDGIEFIKPDLKLLVTNSTPFAGLIMPVFTAEGGSVDGMQLTIFDNIIVPPAPENVTSVSDTISLDKNSNLKEFFSGIPDLVNYSADLILHPGYALTEEVELDNSSSVYFGYMIEIPAEFLLNASITTDTIDISDIDFVQDFVKARLDVKGISSFPFEAEAFIDIYNEEGKQVRETIKAIILNPAEVNSDGIATKVTERFSQVNLTDNQISELSEADKLIVRFKLRSVNYEDRQPVVILTNNSLSVDFTIKGQLNN
ncbi:hypothetical protein J1N10_05095 [Carboxylicivirga sp. A043]|uniref:hypothetical protein n=1 Tax=Carboxylicivirga litoralis TaxID=2816963 RepID=UPI0021CAE5C3|nr:hypothetical protein [Carboxylicivirga sp. A043]MCU4155340.1 hypothetical protein [Carboxylicivirga sp. A043]